VARTAFRGSKESIVPSQPDIHQRPDRPVDALIVGAGVIGLACAWRAAQSGLRVRVLERDRPGAGASGVAAGMLAPVSEVTWGEEPLLAIALTSLRAWAGFATELADVTGLDVGYRPIGALHVALDRDEADELRRRFELMRELGLDAGWLRPAECRRIEPGLAPAIAGGVHAAEEAAVDPRTLLPALCRAAELAGAEVELGADVTEALVADDRIEGVVAGGVEHRATHVVLAAGSWAGSVDWLPRQAVPPVRPVKGQILTLRGSVGNPVCERVVVTERIYAVPRSDGRLVIGATVEEQGFDTTVTAGGVLELLREGYRALPDIAELELTEAEAGLRPGSPDNAPLVGLGELRGLILATGHYRKGMLLAPVTAEAVTSLLRGEEPRPEMIAAAPSRFESALGGKVLPR